MTREADVRDSAAVGVYLARTVPSDDGEELGNWKALTTFGPKLFDRVLYLRGTSREELTERLVGAGVSQGPQA